MFNRILLAVDGSEHALHAAKVAGELAQAVKATELHIVVAYEPIPAYLGEPNLQNVINARLGESHSVLQEAESALGDVSTPVQSEMIEGPIAEAIIAVAQTQHSDLIVMGSRGLGRLAGAVLGSNSQKVVSDAPCPVLIVR